MDVRPGLATVALVLGLEELGRPIQLFEVEMDPAGVDNVCHCAVRLGEYGVAGCEERCCGEKDGMRDSVLDSSHGGEQCYACPSS